MLVDAAAYFVSAFCAPDFSSLFHYGQKLIFTSSLAVFFEIFAKYYLAECLPFDGLGAL